MSEAMSRRSTAIIIVFCGLLLLLGMVSLTSEDASAATYHVPESYPTIQSAIDAARSGDDVLVRKGPYNERIRINKALTLKGVSSNPTIITSSSPGTLITLLSPGITISNIELQGAQGVNGIRGDTIMNCKLKDVTVRDCDQGIYIKTGDHVEIIGCKVHGSRDVGLYVGGILNYRFEYVKISSSFFTNNKGTGVQLERCRYVEIDGTSASSNGRWGIVAHKVAHAHVRNSTLSRNDIGLKLEDCHGWQVEDNIISKNLWDGIELNQSGEDIDNHIRRNQITENSRETGTSYAGISFTGFGATDNVVEYNLIQLNPVGVSFNSSGGGCWRNRFFLNKFSGCVYAINEMRGTGPNTFVLNEFEANHNQASTLNQHTVFDESGLGNFWSDYTQRYDDARREEMVWSEPYRVYLAGHVYDNFPLVRPYEDNAPVVDLGEDLTASFGVSQRLLAMASDESGIDTYEWTIIPPSGFEMTLDRDRPEISYIFNNIGVFFVKVVVTDIWGLSASDVIRVTVIDDIPPVAVPGPDIFVDLGTPVTLDATQSSDNHAIAALHWVFDPSGENIKYHEPIITLEIDELGIYVAILFVIDYAGNSVSESLVIHIQDLSPPVAVAMGDKTISLGTEVTFDGSKSYDNVGIVEYKWTLAKDGAMRVYWGTKVTHAFLELGKYTLDLRVEDSAGLFDIDHLEINVVDTVPPVANAGNDVSALMGTQVVFSSSGSTDNVGITKFQWSFYYQIRTTNLMGRTAKWQFDLPGEYHITLMVWDAAGNFDSDNMKVTILDSRPPTAVFTTPSEVKLGTSLVLDASSSEDNLDVVSYEWKINHKTVTQTLKGMMVEYPVNDPGAYRVTLIVRDAAGNEDTHTTSFNVAPKETVSMTPVWLYPMMVVTAAVVLFVSFLVTRKVYGPKG
jgi:nitrous oxidase accessory protein NosD